MFKFVKILSESDLKRYEVNIINHLVKKFPNKVSDWEYLRLLHYLIDKININYDDALKIVYIYQDNREKIYTETNWYDNITHKVRNHDVYRKALAKFLRAIPEDLLFVENRYSLQEYYYQKNNHSYNIGTIDDVKESVRFAVNDLMHRLDTNKDTLNNVINTELFQRYGSSWVMDYIEIDSDYLDKITIKSTLELFGDEYPDIDSILLDISKDRPDIEKYIEKLQKRIDDMVDQINVSDNQNEIDHLQEKIYDIESQLSELADENKEDILYGMYLDEYDYIKNNTNDWLYDKKIIGMDWNGDYAVWPGEKVPNWVMVNTKILREELEDYLYENSYVEFSYWDDKEYNINYNNTNYYIYIVE